MVSAWGPYVEKGKMGVGGEVRFVFENKTWMVKPFKMTRFVAESFSVYPP